MSLTEPSARRLLPVRLTDIDPDVRLRAARAAARHEPLEDGRRELLATALKPSSTVYFVAVEAAPLLRSIGGLKVSLANQVRRPVVSG